MMPLKDFDWVQRDLTERFEGGMLRKPASLIAIVFIRPDSSLAKGEVLSSIDYFNERGTNTVFYFAGYDDHASKEEQPYVMGPGGDCWYFDAEVFNHVRQEVEGRTTWKYSGACDMILTNARYDLIDASMQGHIDFHTAIVLKLDRLKEISTIQSVGELFEKIFQFAEAQNAGSSNPAWEFSNRAGVGLARSAFKSLILSFLPKALQDDAKGAFHLVAANIAK
jgi:hypothetical protein